MSRQSITAFIREIVLNRYLLHQRVAQPAVHHADRRRVARKNLVGKRIHYILFHSFHFLALLFVAFILAPRYNTYNIKIVYTTI